MKKPSRMTVLVGALIAASVPVLEALATLDPSSIADWRTWAVGVGAACVRQGAVYLLKRAQPTP